MRKQTPAGRWIKTREGYRAFHPDDLPPALEWNPALVRALSDADQRLGRLAGEGRRLPNPYLTVRGAEQKLKTAYNTALRGIEKLCKMGVLQKVSDAKRDRVYCAKAVLDILEEPARLTSTGL